VLHFSGEVNIIAGMNMQKMLTLLFILVISSITAAFAAPPEPVYPRVNPAPWYEVDPAWPQKPDDFKWGAMAGVAVDAEDNVWLFTRGKPAVQVYAPDGRYLFGWDDTEGSHYIKIDREGYVWTCNFAKHIVQKRQKDGTVVMILGVDGEAGTDEKHFFKPTDMAFASNGDIFVTDGYGNARVVHFTKEGKFVNAWGALGTADGQFSIPHAIEIDSKDRLYVADRNNGRIQVYTTAGKLIDSWKDICVPWGLWMSPQDELWVCGSSPMTWVQHPDYPTAPLGCPPKDQLVMKFDTSGKLRQLFTFPKGVDRQEKPGDLNWAHAIALDSKGNLYLGDITGKRLQKFIRKTAAEK
jgi:hypothetical protein